MKGKMMEWKDKEGTDERRRRERMIRGEEREEGIKEGMRRRNNKRNERNSKEKGKKGKEGRKRLKEEWRKGRKEGKEEEKGVRGKERVKGNNVRLK